MSNQKNQMAQAAILYYEKKYTQQEIADIMNLSRQTVSKLLTDAINEKIVEITIHNPESDCKKLEDEIRNAFGLKEVVVCSTVNDNETLRQLMTVKRAGSYIEPFLKQGSKKIGISWGRTIQSFIAELSPICTSNNVVFPLFGATDQEQSYFLSNELARSFADKINAKVKYAWFPYCTSDKSDCELFRKTSYYKKIHELWNSIDIAIVGIGNTTILKLFESAFGYNSITQATGDIATHFFNDVGELIPPHENTLCASKENLKNAKHTIAIACGDDKTQAIAGAMRTQLIDTLITDEYTASKILKTLK